MGGLREDLYFKTQVTTQNFTAHKKKKTKTSICRNAIYLLNVSKNANDPDSPVILNPN